MRGLDLFVRFVRVELEFGWLGLESVCENEILV